MIDKFCTRDAVICPSEICVEIGCGVGCVTAHIASKFGHAIGLGVSEGNLALCDQNFRENGLSNLNPVLLRDWEQVTSLKNVDFILSIIVLQHNPPPLIARMISDVLGVLRSGGAFLIQVPTATPNYKFKVQSYLERFKIQERGFEMHALPMRHVLEIVDRNGCILKEVVMDNWNGMYGSHTLFGVKR